MWKGPGLLQLRSLCLSFFFYRENWHPPLSQLADIKPEMMSAFVLVWRTCDVFGQPSLKNQNWNNAKKIRSLLLLVSYKIDNAYLKGKMTGETQEVRSDKRKPGWPLIEYQSASISIDQHQSFWNDVKRLSQKRQCVFEENIACQCCPFHSLFKGHYELQFLPK